MTLEQLVKKYQDQFDIVGLINLDDWYARATVERPVWLRNKLHNCYRLAYNENQRLLLTLSQGDEYFENSAAGVILTALQEQLNQIDISNFFVVLLTNAPSQIEPARAALAGISTDPVPINVEYFDGELSVRRSTSDKRNFGYNYNSVIPNNISIEQLNDRQREHLFENQNFCIYPWLHMYVGPSGSVGPCCGANGYSKDTTLGSTHNHSLKEIWNDQPMRDLRLRMINNQPSDGCKRCYEQESAGFFSMRNSANKHHGHHINRVDTTKPDGSVDDFSMVYWDVRFSNLCNLRCRSCGPEFSSSWYQDQLKLAPNYADSHKPLIFAGKYETDLWEQLIDHIDDVEQIYFAGGEPMMMDEHYRILEELERRDKFDVRLIYNTNFTQTRLKDRSVFDYWKKFKSVAVGASLDDMGIRGEYIRKGTVWSEVEQNRRLMMQVCPNVDFYISATVSILNAWHVPDFHRSWVEQGLIHARDFNVNIVTDPAFYRLDIAPQNFKQEIEKKYREHIAWLTPQDSLRRASNGYESAIAFMMATDNTHLIDTFWRKTHELDSIRKENILDVIPELRALK